MWIGPKSNDKGPYEINAQRKREEGALGPQRQTFVCYDHKSRNANRRQALEEAKNGFSLGAFRGSAALLTA